MNPRIENLWSKLKLTDHLKSFDLKPVPESFRVRGVDAEDFLEWILFLQDNHFIGPVVEMYSSTHFRFSCFTVEDITIASTSSGLYVSGYGPKKTEKKRLRLVESIISVCPLSGLRL